MNSNKTIRFKINSNTNNKFTISHIVLYFQVSLHRHLRNYKFDGLLPVRDSITPKCNKHFYNIPFWLSFINMTPNFNWSYRKPYFVYLFFGFKANFKNKTFNSFNSCVHFHNFLGVQLTQACQAKPNIPLKFLKMFSVTINLTTIIL